MTEEAFIEKNESLWKRLEEYNTLLDRKRLSRLRTSEIREFSELFRQVSLHLAYARTHFPNGRVPEYLNRLSGAAHPFFFRPAKSGFSDIADYVKSDFANKLREKRVYLWSAFGLFMLGVIVSCAMTLVDIEYAEIFLPKGYTEIITADFEPGVEAAEINSAFLSAYIMTNNINVSVMAFAFGLLAGLGTVYVMFINGAIIGALGSLIFVRGVSMPRFFALILPHGFLELAAIFISGACGLMIGKALLMPGDLKRVDALIKAAKEAAFFIPGIVIMLVAAGLIEGFLTPLDAANHIKISFSFVILAGMLIYYHLGRKRSGG
jgi:uncharacterized membrane protein SpoIIM required for sporulation